ncbi:MAG: TonB-dependent receptor, partial [Tannerellaceae bacterium]|nr:TonB-dependent receptor [Tannerellaceae bacterium]
ALEIAVSFLGYKAFREKTGEARVFEIRLEQEAFALREVEIKPGRISGRDTITYDVARFLSSKDVTVKDVIAKMPGIDVSETGKISYNGKDISNFYVEGMDLVGGRYGQITSNLEAKAVESVQVLENHQPVRMLKDKVLSEAVALNLKLKAEFRDKWMTTLQAAAGLPALLWEGSGNAFQLSRSSQSAYFYKGNNAGHDVTDEQFVFFLNNAGQIREPAAAAFLSQPSIQATLKKDRLLFNDMHTLTANRLYKSSETSRLRLNLAYAHDNRHQDRGSATTYYLPDSTVNVAEYAHTSLRSERAEIGLDYEANADKNFLANRLKMTGEWNESLAGYQGFRSVDQRITTPSLSLRNEFNTLWEQGGNTLEARSLIRYDARPSKLVIDNQRLEDLPLRWMYADHSFAALLKRGGLTQRYTAGVIVQLSNLASGFEPYIIPSWQLSRGEWYASLTGLVRYVNFPGKDFRRLSVNPSFSLRYRPHYAWQFGLYASAVDLYSALTAFRVEEYASDYRTVVRQGGVMPFDRRHSYSAYAEYRRAVYEIFASLSLSYANIKSNNIWEESFENDQRIMSLRNENSRGNNRSIQGSFSKGFYDYGLKLSISALFASNESEQISGGKRLPLRSSYMQYEPKIAWNPFRRFEATWQATVRYGGASAGNADLKPLSNVVQRLNLSYEFGGLEYNLSGDHYYNDLSDASGLNFFLADCSVRWKPGRWEYSAALTNIFNTAEYRYTQYSSTQSYTSWMNIRGRELMLSARYRFR